jgi:NADPH2:quinone reductase
VHPLPNDVSYAQGAALGVPYATAYRALFQRGRATAGETLLVHGASGGVGLAAVQFALDAGLQVVATAGSEAGGELVASQGDVKVLDHRDPAHVAAAFALTGERGFDLIFELSAHQNLGSRAPVEINPRDLMTHDGAIVGMLLANASPAQLAEAHEAISAGLRSGALRPVVGREFPLADAARAHHHVMERPALGKVVLVP